MKRVAIALLALLICAFISFALDSAWALTAATFTDKATLTSLTSGKWKQVWTNSTGYSYFIDASAGSFKSVRLDSTGATSNTATQTLSASSNQMAVSNVETVSSVRRVYVAQLMSNTAVEINIVNIDTGAIISATNSTISIVSAGTGNEVSIVQTKNKIWFAVKRATSGTVYEVYTDDRAPTGTMTSEGSRTTATNNLNSITCAIDTNGAAYASDEIVCIIGNVAGSGGTVGEVNKWTSVGVTDIGDLCVSNLASSAPELTEVSDKLIIRMTCAGTENVHTYTKSSDALSGILYTTDWLNWNVQPFNFDGTSKTFQATNKAYLGSTSHSAAYNASSGALSDPDACYAETVASSTITCVNDSPYYRISDALIVSGSGTTWTPRAISGARIEPTVYSETLGVPLTENATVINDNVIKLVCDAIYTLEGTPTIAGDDSDCTGWRVLDTSAAIVGRNLSYADDRDLVHAIELTGYTIHVSAAAPEQYFLTAIYEGKDVDSGNFDSGGDVAQRLLYGQCYTMEIQESDSGNILLSGDICANDVNPKTVSLSGLALPDDWLGNIWSHSITRYFNASDPGAPPSANSTNNHVLFSVEKSIKPYNASVNIVDHPEVDDQTLNVWYNFTDATGISVVNRTGIFSNQTLYFTVYENGVIVLNDISMARLSPGNIDLVSWMDRYGLLFGIPIALVFPIITAALFPRSMAHIGIIATGAVIGIEQYFGLFRGVAFNEGIWGIAFGLIALGVVYAKR